MDDSLYDEFGNFIGTVESDEELDGADELEARANAYLEEDEDEEQVQEENLMQVDGGPSFCIANI
jgi:116 kDa U5 small nuclear ribonucleoprotein component